MSDLKNKYNRVAQDASQLQQFVNEMIDKLNNTHGVHIIEKSGENGDSIEFTAEEKAMLLNKDELAIIKFTDTDNDVVFWCYPYEDYTADLELYYLGNYIHFDEDTSELDVEQATIRVEKGSEPLYASVTIQIKTIIIPTTEALNKKANIIRLVEGQDINTVLDDVQAGDIVLGETAVFIIGVKYTTECVIFLILDDGTISTNLYRKEDNTWTYYHSLDFVDYTTLEGYLNIKANIHILTGSQTVLSQIENIHKGDIVVDNTTGGEMAYLCCYETANSKGFLSVDDTSTLGYSLYSKTDDIWALDNQMSWDFSPINDKGSKLYRHAFEVSGRGWIIEIISNSDSAFKGSDGKLNGSAIRNALIISVLRKEDPSGDYVIHGIPGPSTTYYLALRTISAGDYSYDDLLITTETINPL